ncbi:MAG TPA: FRG domain-containing protein [Pyrinomonadaceae bacterium]|nr:FRG domain-containing protein [Pyrinomonadaceae bacterium]
MTKPDIKIETVMQLFERIGDYDDRTMFRGQVDKWPLLPTIARLHRSVLGYDDWRGFHEDTVERFKRQSRPHFRERPVSEVEWLVHAQHHGLPTRLLDWTSNPLKGLFFSVDNPQYDRTDGVLWKLEPTHWWETITDSNQTAWETELGAFFPEQLNDRLIAQQGCFLSFPLPANTRKIKPLESRPSGVYVDQLVRFRIPAKAKYKLRNTLALLGINHASMFPSLDGVAKTIKINLIDSSQR